ncbi:MAG: hypothetical protein EXQ90_01365 [Rhodospirillales bacterium]|nr:hypothetical protein [Rhodospirillales bacterium]
MAESRAAVARRGSARRAVRLGFVRIGRSPSWPFVLLRIALVVALPIFVALYHDLNRHYLWQPDFEIGIVYNALVLGSGLPNFHPGQAGFGHFYLLTGWFTLLKGLGVINVASLEDLAAPPLVEAQFQALMFWARTLSLIFIALLVVVVMRIGQELSGSRAYGFLAALAFAGTQSLNNHVVHLRTDTSAVFLAYLAILLFVMAVNRDRNWWRSVELLIAGAFFFVAAFYARTSIFPLLLVIPLIPLVFAPSAKSEPAGRVPPATELLLLAAAIIAASLALPHITERMSRFATVYYSLFVLYALGGLLVYRYRRGMRLGSVAAAGSALMLGTAAAIYLFTIEDHVVNTDVIANPVEYLSTLGGGGLTPALGILQMVRGFFAGLGAIFTEGVFNFCWVCRRVSIVYLIAFILLVFIWIRGDRELRWRATILILAFAFVEGALRLYYFNNFYRVYVEGLLFATTAFYAVSAIRKASPRWRRRVAVLATIFAVWFAVDDVSRKMLWPSFAAHIGDVCLQRLNTPGINHFFDRYCGPDSAFKGREPWYYESRPSFLGRREPWVVPPNYRHNVIRFD